VPVTPPAICDTVVSIDAPQYRDEILAALGIVTRDIGLTFTVGEGATLRIVEVSPIPLPGYEHHAAVFNGDVIYLQPWEFTPRAATRLVLHELGHWMRMEHNDYAHSVMNTAGWPLVPAYTTRDITEARSLTSYCR